MRQPYMIKFRPRNVPCTPRKYDEICTNRLEVAQVSDGSGYISDLLCRSPLQDIRSGLRCMLRVLQRSSKQICWPYLTDIFQKIWLRSRLSTAQLSRTSFECIMSSYILVGRISCSKLATYSERFSVASTLGGRILRNETPSVFFSHCSITSAETCPHCCLRPQFCLPLLGATKNRNVLLWMGGGWVSASLRFISVESIHGNNIDTRQIQIRSNK